MDKNGRLKHFLPLSFLIALTILFFHPVLFQGKTFYAFDSLLKSLPWSSYSEKEFRPQNPLITDPVNLSYPASNHFKTCLEERVLPFWKTYNFCGTAFSGGELTAHTSPVQFLLLAFLPVLAAHDTLLWLYLCATSLFMYRFLLKIGIRLLPAMIGAVSWMFNGYVMVWFEFEMILILSASLPASLLCVERWNKEQSLFNALCFIGTLAISISSGFAHLIIYQSLFILCYIGYRIFSMKSGNSLKITRNSLRSVLISASIGICISTTFFTTHLTLLNQPQRQIYSFKELYDRTGELPSRYLLTSIFPDFFGNPATSITFTPSTSPFQSYNNYNELCIYSGILPLFLTLLCLPALFKRKFILFFFLSAILSLTMAMGSVLYYPLMKTIPGLGMSTPTRILYIFTFSICVLGAIGADTLLDVHPKKKWVYICLTTIIPAISLITTWFMQTPEGIKWVIEGQRYADWKGIYEILHAHFALTRSGAILKPLFLVFVNFLVLILILMSTRQKLKSRFLFLGILVLSYDLISFGLIYNTAAPKKMAYPETESIRFLKADSSLYRVISYGSFMHNTLSPFGIEDVGGYSTFYPRRYGEYLHLTQYGPEHPVPEHFSRWMFFRRFGSPLLNLINTKYLLMPQTWTPKATNLHLVYDGDVKIYENGDVFPRVFFVPEYQFCGTPEETLEKASSFGNEDFKAIVLLEKHPPKGFMKNGSDTRPADSQSLVKILTYKPDRIVMEVSSSRNGFLVISNNFDPGWKAKIDDDSAELLQANYIMQALPITEGRHIVQVYYRPTLSIVSIIVSSTGWVLLVLMIGVYGLIKLIQQRKHNPAF